MKNKITKLFLALLAITFGSNAQAQDQPMPDYVRKATNIEYLKQFAERKTIEFEENYKKAVEIAKREGKPIFGEKDGSAFALAGYNEETGGLIYKSTYNKVVLESSNMFFNNVTVGSSLQTANAKLLHTEGITGLGMTVGVWDGGAGLTNHLAFSGGRYQIKNNANSGANEGGKAHAAHVAGTVAGAGFGSGVTKGFAYEATVHAYFGLINDLPSMTAAATATVNPMYVSNHSYGLNFGGSNAPVSVFGQYNSEARAYDELANEAPYYTMVFAAGNDRQDGFNPTKIGGKDLLSQGGVSKNTVVVAATRGTEDYSGITGLTSVSMVGGVRAFIAPYSSYGPTDDFRIKPDIAAKGGEILPGNPATDPVTSVGILAINATADMQGTSMAAPAVTGVFTLWQSYHNQIFSKYMRSASVRALMAHTAREAGPAAGPDFMFGWGLIDAYKGKQLMFDANAGAAYFQEHDLAQGAQFNYEFEYNGQQPLIVTVAWNDPAGVASNLNDINVKKLINDLDVRLINTSSGATYYPWSLVHNWSLAPTSSGIAVRNVDNARDNIEKIEPVGATAGNYRVEVTHKGTTLSGGVQNFSIIVSGAVGSVSTPSLALESIKMYPNPAKDFLTIEGDLSNLQNASVDVYDVAGRRVLKAKIINETSMNLNVSQLKQGMYIMTIIKDGVKQDYKFLKN